LSEFTQYLSFENIFTLAERESGAFDIADDGLMQRAKAMIEGFNANGPYTFGQIDAMSRQIQRLLVNRLRIAQDRLNYPEIAEEKIEQPIFVIGFARSGTTLLHQLLSEDPETLAPQAWHTRMSSPPPGAGPIPAGRIAVAQRMIEEYIDLCPGQLIVHPYGDRGAMRLIEDEEILTLDFRNRYPNLLYRVPKLDVAVTVENDSNGIMQFHREMLQHLQWNTGKNRWATKFNTAQYHMEALFETYPDALCVWAHRPLSEIYASNVTARAMSFDAINNTPMDWSTQAREHALRMKSAVERMMSSSMIDDPRILHLPFHDLAADPIRVMERIYEKRGREFNPAYRERLNAWLNDPENRVDRYGRYKYSYEPLGLDKQWIEELFADYSERFGLRASE